MRILHLCLCGFYSEGWGYQDNLMAEQNARDGHEVYVIAGQYRRTTGTRIEKAECGEYSLGNGVTVIRIPARFDAIRQVREKLRVYRNLYQAIDRVAPDVIFSHGLQFIDLDVVGEFARNHPDVRVYADNHASRHNSARGFLSRYLLHGTIYRSVILGNFEYFRKIFYVTYDCGRFLRDVYGIQQKLEFMPLCGRLMSRQESSESRKALRTEYGVGDHDLAFVHAGKLDKDKKTLDVLRQFARANREDCWLFIVGHISEDIRKEAMLLIGRSDRIVYAGWRSSAELERFLCAGDVLLQPGSQSVIFQQAIACGMALILDRNVNTEYLVSHDNGVLLDDVEDIPGTIQFMADNRAVVSRYRANSWQFAVTELNYGVQSRKYLAEGVGDE